jgi:hypothetical protein
MQMQKISNLSSNFPQDVLASGSLHNFILLNKGYVKNYLIFVYK